IGLAAPVEGGHPVTPKRDDRHMHGADGVRHLIEPPGCALVEAHRHSGGIVTAVPALPRTWNAAEDRHHPAAIRARNETGAHKSAQREIDLTRLATPELSLLKPHVPRAQD